MNFILEAKEGAYTLNEGDCIYAYFPTSYRKEVEVILNNNFLYKYNDDYHFTIIPLGSYSDKEQVSLELKLLKDELHIRDEKFYSLDMDLFKDAMRELNSNPLKITKNTETLIKGTVYVRL